MSVGVANLVLSFAMRRGRRRLLSLSSGVKMMLRFVNLLSRVMKMIGLLQLAMSHFSMWASCDHCAIDRYDKVLFGVAIVLVVLAVLVVDVQGHRLAPPCRLVRLNHLVLLVERLLVILSVAVSAVALACCVDLVACCGL